MIERLRPTDHGEMIANQIQGEDAYGYDGQLNLADIWLILDNIHSSFVETEHEGYCKFLEKWMEELEQIDPSVVSI